ncbi:uncharacterized protein LOC143896675 isoform X2 [Temnothorax americanus]|uniref:uncharacterized protein LOC143896675 isoform X2 n=1 Tax=Temnothorax americanus TaxID=1964332 RepID=UPI0040693711
MDSDIGATATLVQQQHQSLDGNHHQGQKEQDNVNGTVESAKGHAVDRFRGEAGCSGKEIAVIAPDNDSVGDSSTQCSDVIDDGNEEEETDVEESGAGGWIMNPPVSTIVQQLHVHFTHQSDASVSLEIPTSSNEGTTRSSPTRPSGTPSGTNTCKAPPQPQNGRWKLHRSQCSDGQDCNVPEGTELGLGSHLVYSCDSGYKIRGSTDGSCSIERKWLNIPVCTAILCKALAVSSIRSECLYNDEWISCKFPVPPKTKATLSCEKSYRPETNLLSGQRTNVRCNKNGEWEPEPMRCVPGPLIKTKAKK